MKYLDPKADLTFKKVFGEHPDLVMSLLNALLPFDKPEEEVQSIEYLPAELVPDNPLRKNSIVDVRCKDARGRAGASSSWRCRWCGRRSSRTACCSTPPRRMCASWASR